MKGLLIKDFKLMKMQKNFFIMIVVISFVVSLLTEDVTFMLGFISFITSLFTISTISYDEFDNGNAFSNSAPLTINLWERSFRSTILFLCSRIFLLWIACSSSFLLFSMLALSSSNDMDSYFGFFALLTFLSSFFCKQKEPVFS